MPRTIGHKPRRLAPSNRPSQGLLRFYPTAVARARSIASPGDHHGRHHDACSALNPAAPLRDSQAQTAALKQLPSRQCLAVLVSRGQLWDGQRFDSSLSIQQPINSLGTSARGSGILHAAWAWAKTP
ncbi:hypothetical protein CDD81_114 [Ophiocordyceps australis]|uniref:Uncharacterized protein n=1 Tax=Ophiocordyceps australis TaxID=1399860 RepID=A0A2C5XN92_9HYPO|nr:hypothetical protein CDD81_114 [Ophiocordyceps australis]